MAQPQVIVKKLVQTFLSPWPRSLLGRAMALQEAHSALAARRQEGREADRQRPLRITADQTTRKISATSCARHERSASSDRATRFVALNVAHALRWAVE